MEIERSLAETKAQELRDERDRTERQIREDREAKRDLQARQDQNMMFLLMMGIRDPGLASRLPTALPSLSPFPSMLNQQSGLESAPAAAAPAASPAASDRRPPPPNAPPGYEVFFSELEHKWFLVPKTE